MKDKKAYIFVAAVIIACLALISIKNTNKEIEKEKDFADKKIRIDTILLGYRFGMSPDEFNTHTKKLIASGKLTNDGKLTFDKEPPFFVKIQPEYFHNKLYKLYLPLFFSREESSNELLFLYGANVLSQKYLLEKTEGISYTQEKGNLKVGAYNNIYRPFIEYLDKPVDSIINAEKEQNFQEKAKDL